MRYFTKLTVEYCRIFVINCIFAAGSYEKSVIYWK